MSTSKAEAGTGKEFRVVHGVQDPSTTTQTHGEAETAAYVLSGSIRVYFGDDFKEYIDAGPGDFIFVPANTPHIEGNVTDEPAEAVLSRGPDNIVVNLGE
jgi:uncharacterized RmlC-like cupin family protein